MFLSSEWDVKWCPVSKVATALTRQIKLVRTATSGPLVSVDSEPQVDSVPPWVERMGLPGKFTSDHFERKYELFCFLSS